MSSSTAASAALPTKKAKISHGGSSGPTSSATRSDDLTPSLQRSYILSLLRRHRDQAREAVRLAKGERDRAHLSLEQSKRVMERANEHLEKMKENELEANKEYLDAKNLLDRVRQSRCGGSVHAVDGSSDDKERISSKKKGSSDGGGGESPKRSLYQRYAHIEDILVSLAKSGQLHMGTKLSDTDCNLIDKKEHKIFVHAMKLVEETWTDEEESFLRSSCEEIEKSIEEAKIIAATISVRCLTKLNEYEGRDPSPSNSQKPSYNQVGRRARAIFLTRKKAEQSAVV